jgi:arginine deiminase
MKREHKSFVKMMEKNGVKLLEFKTLLTEILRNDEAKRRIINEFVELEGYPSLKIEKMLDSWEPENIVEILFTGITYDEWKKKSDLDMPKKGDEFLISPIPHSYYTRDSVAAIGDGIVPCRMAYPVRAREAVFMKYIFRYHPIFERNVSFWLGEQEVERSCTIEGGDITMLNCDTVAIGHSKRTRPSAIEKIAKNLFENNMIDILYEIRIPSKSIYGHLDSVFSIISDDIILFYPDALIEKIEIKLYKPSMEYGNLTIRKETKKSGLREELSDILGGDIIVLKTGGGIIHYGEKEQFAADGTNLLAIASKKVITYARNEKTNQELEDNGVKTIIIKGSELVRGRGGTRSMVMPIARG